jgi:hypothetical protein
LQGRDALRRLASLARRPSLTPSYSLADLAATSLAAAWVAAWAAVAAESFSVRALIACEAAFLAFYLAGSLFAAWRPLAAGALFDLPLRLLAGYAAVNTTLLVLAWLSPLGIVANFGVVLVAAALLFVAARPVRQAARDGAVGLAVVGLSLAAATLWCQDSIRPPSVDGNNVVFQPWIDSFYHALHVRIFGAAHGASSIEDFRMAGVPARLYHYGAYLTPALIRQASGLRSYAVFAGVLAPMGVFFTGLGAYALFGSFWGKWPGLAAAAALLLLPDGAQQGAALGMPNTFMSYRWLTQISPSASYGLALLALAWLFVLLGCTRGSRLQLVLGWLVAAVLAVAAALYAVTIVVVQRVPDVPKIRFDGSGIGQLLTLIKGFSERGGLRDFLDRHIGADSSTISNLGIGAPYVLLAALGIFAPLLVIMAIRLRRQTPAVLVVLPLVLVANFLAMFLGLALDLRSSTPDELSHRPVMIVYFAVVAWVGGAGGLLLFASPRLARVAPAALVGLAVLGLAIPARLGSGVQRLAAMPMYSPVRVPIGLVRAAEYIRDHADGQDIFQDSQFDWTCVVAAMAERRTYAARTLTIMTYNGDLQRQRMTFIEKLMDLRDAAAVTAAARQIGLRWFLVEPGDQIAWPAEIAQRPAFELAGYRVYRL